MRLNALLVADAVSAPPDGKFYIHGGGLTRLTVPQMPFVVPRLALFIRLEVDADEVGTSHEFCVEFRDPQGGPRGALSPFTAIIPPPVPELVEGEERFVVITLNIAGIPIEQAGLHSLVFLIDGEVVSQTQFPVLLVPPVQPEGVKLAAPRPTGLPPRNRAQARRRPPPPSRRRT